MDIDGYGWMDIDGSIDYLIGSMIGLCLAFDAMDDKI